MLSREKNAVCFQIHTLLKNTISGQKVVNDNLAVRIVITGH